MKAILRTTFVLFISQSAFSQSDSMVVATTSPVLTDTAIRVTSTPVSTNTQVYKVNNWVDIPLTIATTGYTLYGFSRIYGGEKTPEATILALNPQDVNSLDRPVTKYHSQSAKAASDKLFYGSMPMPLIFLLDKKMRKDAAKIGLLYVQAASVFGSIYVSASMISRRFRPYTYNPEVDMGRRTGGGGRNSFPAGHPGFVATATFFMAKVYSDYHPEMRNKWILYTIAGSASVATGILRVKAGEHFITDVMVGVPLGVLTGILVPHIHKNRKPDARLSITPVYSNGMAGFHGSWKLK